MSKQIANNENGNNVEKQRSISLLRGKKRKWQKEKDNKICSKFQFFNWSATAISCVCCHVLLFTKRKIPSPVKQHGIHWKERGLSFSFLEVNALHFIQTAKFNFSGHLVWHQQDSPLKYTWHTIPKRFAITVWAHRVIFISSYFSLYQRIFTDMSLR